MADNNKLIPVKGSDFEETTNPTGTTFMGFKTVGGILKSIRISFENMAALFGVTQSITEGDTTHAVSSDAIYKKVTGGSTKKISELDNNKADKVNASGDKVVYSADGKISIANATDVQLNNPTNGDILIRIGDKWKNIPIPSMIDYFAYGVEWDTQIADTALTRIGSALLHKTLPIHNKMRGCLLADDGTVNKYLNANDWTGETLDGSGGQVMVEIPVHYRKFESEGTKRRILISEYELHGYEKIEKCYVSAFEASIQRSTMKMASVVNDTPDYRGGMYDVDTSSWDGTYRSMLGLPAGFSSRVHIARGFARSRGSLNWNMLLYDTHKTLVYLYLVEYANFNSRLPFTETLTSEGYKQGVIGTGASDIITRNENYEYNLRNLIIPCGYTNDIGNNTGVKAFSMPEEFGRPLTTEVNRYRGIENFIGHGYKTLDQIILSIKEVYPAPINVYYCKDINKLSPTSTPNSNYEHMSLEVQGTSYVGWIKKLLEDSLFPSVLGGSATTYMASMLYMRRIATINYIYAFAGSSIRLETNNITSGLFTLNCQHSRDDSGGVETTRLVYLTNK